jgi:hypothetical protein
MVDSTRSTMQKTFILINQKWFVGNAHPTAAALDSDRIGVHHQLIITPWVDNENNTIYIMEINRAHGIKIITI